MKNGGYLSTTLLLVMRTMWEKMTYKEKEEIIKVTISLETLQQSTQIGGKPSRTAQVVKKMYNAYN